MLPIAYLFHRAILLKRADRVTFPCKSSSHYIQTKYLISTRIKRKRFERTRVIISYFSTKFINSYPRSRIYLYIYIFFSLKTSPISNSPISSWFLSKLFSQQLIYMIYIYIYTHFRAFVRLLKSNTKGIETTVRNTMLVNTVDGETSGRERLPRKKVCFLPQQRGRAWRGAARRDVKRGCNTARDRLSTRTKRR